MFLALCKKCTMLLSEEQKGQFVVLIFLLVLKSLYHIMYNNVECVIFWGFIGLHRGQKEHVEYRRRSIDA